MMKRNSRLTKETVSTEWNAQRGIPRVFNVGDRLYRRTSETSGSIH